ncbi:ATP-binding protein [Mucilaginibacter sp. 10I4]|uniref:ATP-binding protein n=1 Tax=Mucilaginibacter sp. 10I4 TaxID=3048580 RepID=UPI002B23AC56|nr:ATP-binding protein [Mucilaginibacter sp. 10I4]MEB0264039.1 ATP-binding protein [Mucilaginibacter sp. 10I4]
MKTDNGLYFKRNNLDRLFPFYVLINSDLIIEAYGPSMKKLHANCLKTLFTDSFKLIRPVESQVEFDTLVRLAGSLVIIKGTSGAITTSIKGQFESYDQEQKLLFIGSPWFNSIEELTITGLSINDFAHIDPTIDLLHLLKSQEIINEDLIRLVTTINEQKNKLKKGEKIILNTLEKERELNKLKTDFVTITSHEFRTPLACISSSVELIQFNNRPVINADYAQRHLTNIMSEVDHLSKLIDEILTVGQMESAGLRCKKETVNIDDIINTIIDNISAIQNDGRSVTVIRNGIPKVLLADPILLNHVLKYLIANALKYSESQKQPILTLVYRTKQLVIRVKDFGMGIPYIEQDKVFQAFFRAGNVHHIKGNGLGLFISKNIVELHGGQIRLKSTPNVSTEFSILLPLQ